MKRVIGIRYVLDLNSAQASSISQLPIEIDYLDYFDDLSQHYGTSKANTLQLPQFCTKPSVSIYKMPLV